MKTNLLPIFLAVAQISLASASGQTADNLVLQGKAFLGRKDLTNANARFASAVAVSPTHKNANVLYAGTRLLTLIYQQPAQDMMDRLDVDLEGRNIYHWTAQILTDELGVPFPPNDFDTHEAIAFVRTNVLPEIRAALGNLSVLTSTNFILPLSSNETTLGAVTLDYGDIQMLRALLHGAEFLTYTINSHNFSAQLADLYNLLLRDELNAGDILFYYPQAFTFANANDFAAARTAFQNAVDRYMVASDHIRHRPANIIRLFNYDPGKALDEFEFRRTLIELTNSLTRPVLTHWTNGNTRITAHLAKFFEGSLLLRSFLPDFIRNGIILGSLPDPTFNGLVLGLTAGDIEYFVIHNSPEFEPLSRLGLVRGPAPGKMQLFLTTLRGELYRVEASQDLVTWVPIADVLATNSLVSFEDPDAMNHTVRYYRARDLSDLIFFEGVVRDVLGRPVAGATVTFGSESTVTDANGQFALLTSEMRPRIGFYSLIISAPGYLSSEIQGAYFGGNHLQNLQLHLVPVAPVAWARHAGGEYDDRGNGLALDGNGNIYVTGSFLQNAFFGNTNLVSSGFNEDIFLAKYDSAGGFLWARRAGGTDRDTGRFVAVDSSNNVYVTGEFFRTASFGATNLINTSFTDDIFLARYNSEGNVTWARKVDGNAYELVKGLAVDGGGNIYLTGEFYSTLAFGNTNLTNSGFSSAIFLAKFDSDGNVRWARRAGGTDYNSVEGIATDVNGNTFITGVFNSTAVFGNTNLSTGPFSYDVFVVKYDTDGNVAWARRAGGSGFESGRGIAVDGSGHVFVTGVFDGTATFSQTNVTSRNFLADIFVAKYDANGGLIWVRSEGGNDEDEGRTVVADNSGGAYVAGIIRGNVWFGNVNFRSLGYQDIFIARYDTAGNLLKIHQTGSRFSEAIPTGIALGGTGDLYVTGFFYDAYAFGSMTLDSNGGYDAFLFDLSGAP